MSGQTIRAPTLRVGGKFRARVFGAGSEAARASVRSALIRQLAGSSSGGEPVTVRFERFVLELTTAAGSRKISREDLTVRLDLGDAVGVAGAAPQPVATEGGNGSAVPRAAPESYRGDDFLRILVKMMVLVWAMGDEEVEDDEGNPDADSGDDGADGDAEPEEGGGEGMFGLF